MMRGEKLIVDGVERGRRANTLVDSLSSGTLASSSGTYKSFDVFLSSCCFLRILIKIYDHFFETSLSFLHKLKKYHINLLKTKAFEA